MVSCIHCLSCRPHLCHAHPGLIAWVSSYGAGMSAAEAIGQNSRTRREEKECRKTQEYTGTAQAAPKTTGPTHHDCVWAEPSKSGISCILRKKPQKRTPPTRLWHRDIQGASANAHMLSGFRSRKWRLGIGMQACMDMIHKLEFF